MKQVVSAKLKLFPSPEQAVLLRQTQLAYRDALNFTSKYAFEHGKTSNQIKIHNGVYYTIREQYGLPAQMACGVSRQVGACYKSLWTKTKNHIKMVKLGRTKKRYKGLDQPPKFVSPTIPYCLGRDFSFKKDGRVSVETLHGRVVVEYSGYNKHLELIKSGTRVGGAKLWYDKPKKQFYLIVSLEIEIADPLPETHTRVTGIDVGQRYLATVSDTNNNTVFFRGGAAKTKADHFAGVRKQLQQKGTRSATRTLMGMESRERRFKLDTNHCIAKQIVERFPNSIIGIEDLTNIKERTFKKRKKGKRASKKQRKANRQSSNWSFADLQSKVAYKATLSGSMTIKVDADYTSQMCPKCGHTSKSNRPGKGLMFKCLCCGYTLHADLIGSRNIALRTLLVRQDWARTGCLSTSPDVSDKEAKAERLKRYSELRWSPETSLIALA